MNLWSEEVLDFLFAEKYKTLLRFFPFNDNVQYV